MHEVFTSLLGDLGQVDPIFCLFILVSFAHFYCDRGQVIYIEESIYRCIEFLMPTLA